MAFVDGAREDRTAEVAVVGGGPAGLMSAIALAAGGVDTLLIARQPENDHRTTALLAGSVTALTTLGVWQDCLPHAAPLVTIRIIDDTQRLLRAPEVTFNAADIGLDAFGYNIENRHLLAALYARAAQLNITRIGGAAVAVDSDATGVTIKLDDGTARVRLVVGADGQRSLCRAAAGIGTRTPRLSADGADAQSRARRGRIRMRRPNSTPRAVRSRWWRCPAGARASSGCSTRSAPRNGPPPATRSFPPRSSAAPIRSSARYGSSAAAACFRSRWKPHIPSDARALRWSAKRRTWCRRSGRRASISDFATRATLAELVADAHRQHFDVGSPSLLARYDAQRRADATSRRIAIDLLNRSLLSDFIPVQGVRGLSLFLVDRIGPLRRALMREGVTPAASQPRLMRGEMV